MGKTFLTFFPRSENEHLAKDVGAIPNILAREFGYESYLAVYSKGQKFEYLNTFAKHLKIRYIKSPKNPKNRKISLQSILFFVKNARKIDIVNFYHLSLETMILSIIYKFINRKGLIYVKADIDIAKFEKNYPYLKNSIFKTLLGNVLDLVSVEQQKAVNIFNVNFPKLKDKIFYLPNGIDFTFLENIGFKQLQKTDKEEIIITVGRLGTIQKNNEMMLEALNGFDLKNWRFVFIGPFLDETDIKPKIERFYSDNPNLKDKIIFTGNITNKTELYNWYKKAKVFCLTSKWESFGLALADSLYFGCEIISTPISSFNELTNNNDFGYRIQNSDDLRNILEKIVNEEIDALHNYEKIIEYSKNFSWSKICEKLHIRITNSF